jgi:hypothetical protein
VARQAWADPATAWKQEQPHAPNRWLRGMHHSRGPLFIWCPRPTIQPLPAPRVGHLGQPLQQARELLGQEPLDARGVGQGQAGSAMIFRQARSSRQVTERRELYDLGSPFLPRSWEPSKPAVHHQPDGIRLREALFLKDPDINPRLPRTDRW